MRRKSLIALLLVVGMSLGIVGCGTAQSVSNDDFDPQGIVLEEPVSAQTGTDIIQRRDLYNYKVYTGSVFPYIQEYAADKGMTFNNYGAYPGEEVKPGTELIISNTESVDENIKKQKESIENLTESHEKTIKGLKEDLEEYKGMRQMFYNYMQSNLAEKPAEDSAGYADWKTGYDYVENSYRLYNHQAEMTERAIEQENASYELDLANENKKLERLKKQRTNNSIVSGMDGQIVAMNFYNPGDWIEEEKNVIAVGDPNVNQLISQYISKTDINSAYDVFALINGKRYEVEYHPIEAEEYLRLTSQGEKVFSYFTLLDAEDVELGSYVSICVISEFAENAVTVPKKALQRDGSEWFVYRIDENGDHVRTVIRTGMSDGVYTEVLSGLEDGDTIVYSNPQKAGSSGAKVERGSFATKYSEKGYMFYPSSTLLENPVEYGTTYFKEYQVELYQPVKKGDVIATVRVEGDSIGLERQLVNKKYLQQDIDDLQKQIGETTDKEQLENLNEKLDSYKERMAELDENIAKRRGDSDTKEIVADKSGVITWMNTYKDEQIISSGEIMVQIADQSKCYVVVEDKSGKLQYGNRVDVSYESSDGETKTVEGMVANVSASAVSKSINTDYVLILLPEDKIAEMLQASAGSRNRWYRISYNVTGLVYSMENVLMVPRKAVWEQEQRTYVYVKQADGSVKAQSIITGGVDNEHYWVIEGLTEGMEVCLD